MRFALVAVGSRGDVEPYIALGALLHELGHCVRVAALDPFESHVREAGLKFHTLGALPERFRPRPAGKRGCLNSSTVFGGISGRVLFWSLFPRMLAPALDRFISACDGADVVVYSRLALPVPHVAERFAIPCFAGFPVPHTPTAAFENPLYSRPEGSGALRTRATYSIESTLTHQLSHGLIARWRRERLGLPPVRRLAVQAHLARFVQGTLYAYSEAVVPRPAEWPEHVQVTGYWLRDSSQRFEPPVDVRRFVEDGEPPICVGFGSMKSADPTRLGALVADALARLGRRAIWQCGWGEVRPIARTTKDILVTGDLPHGWLFPRCAAVVHHGGAGTTGAALRAGIPSLVIPHAFDQRFWGRRISALGCGPRPIELRELTAERLVRALRAALADDGIRAAARSLGERLRGEDGPGCAAYWLSRWTMTGEVQSATPATGCTGAPKAPAQEREGTTWTAHGPG